jgi:DNA-binding transcriptional LysR family regulator
MPIGHGFQIAAAWTLKEADMDLKLLKAFVTVAEHGTVSKASELLHITQPALSRQLHGLEHQVGFQLFERAGRGLRLTARGEQFFEISRGMLATAGAFSERAQQLRRGDIQVLRVAAAALTIEALFPAFLRIYAERVPGVRLTLTDAHGTDHVNMLERGEADVSVNVINMLPLDVVRFECSVLPSFHMLAACTSAFALGTGDAIDIALLARHPLLVLDRSYATRNVFDAACHLADVKPSIFFESRSVGALLAMAERGHGVAIVPSVLKNLPADIGTKLVTHRDEPLPLKVAVIWDRRRTTSRHAEQFAHLLAEYVSQAYPAAGGRSHVARVVIPGRPAEARRAKAWRSRNP